MNGVDSALEVIDRFLGRGTPPAIESAFDPSFLAQIPAFQLEEIFADLRQQLGICAGHQVLEKPSMHARRVRWSFESGYEVEGVLGVGEGDSPRIVMLHFGVPGRAGDSWDQVEAGVRELPAPYTFEVRDLTRGEVLSAVEPDQRVCVGSTSKLVIYSCLLDRILAGERRWEDTIALGASAISAPSGVMHVWPVGAPLTLHTAAVLLLTMSDNTAADLLLHELGREAVEAVAAEVAGPGPPPCTPFLTTRAICKLVVSSRAQQDAYRAANVAGRRQQLVKLEASAPAVGEVTSQAFPEDVGWFFSAREIGRLLERIQPQVEADEMAHAIMSATPQAIAGDHWSFVGSKGGSSPGRFSVAALLRNGAGRWIAASIALNTVPENLKQGTCATLLRRATDLAIES